MRRKNGIVVYCSFTKYTLLCFIAAETCTERSGEFIKQNNTKCMFVQFVRVCVYNVLDECLFGCLLKQNIYTRKTQKQ